MECEERDRHAISNRIRDAQLPRMKTLEEFDFAQAPQISAARIRELAEGGYVERSEPIVLIGEAGTGKSHLATGLCVAACQQKRRVRFTTAAALVNELVEAKQNNQVRRLMSRWQRYQLIALDEVGYVPLADIGAEFLFQVISDRAERAALIITTNTLCGAPHNKFNAESIFMRTPRSMEARPRSCCRLFTPHIGSSLQHLDQLVRCFEAACPQLRSDHRFEGLELHGRVGASVNLRRLHTGMPKPERHLPEIFGSLQDGQSAGVSQNMW